MVSSSEPISLKEPDYREEKILDETEELESNKVPDGGLRAWLLVFGVRERFLSKCLRVPHRKHLRASVSRAQPSVTSSRGVYISILLPFDSTILILSKTYQAYYESTLLKENTPSQM